MGLREKKQVSPEARGKSEPQLYRHLVPFTLIICVVYGSYALVANNWGVLLAPLAIQSSFTLNQVGLLVVVWLLGYLPGALLGGMILDYRGPRFVLIAGLLLMAGGLGAILVSLSLTLHLLVGIIICAGVAGIGGGIVDASTTGLMSNLYQHRRGAALNLFTALYPLSAMAISFIDGGLLLAFHNAVQPLLLFPLAVVLLALFSVAGLSDPARGRNWPNSPPQNGGVSRQPLLRQMTRLLPVLSPILLAIVLTAGFTSTIRTWTPAYLHVTYGQIPALAAFMSGFMNGIVVLSRLFVSIMVDRIGTRRTLLLGLLVAIGGLVGSLAASSNGILGVTALTLTAIGLTPIVATFVAFGNERAGTWLGSVSGWIMFTVGVSNTIWNWLFGLALDRAGSSWAILSCLLPLCCGTIILFFLKGKRKTVGTFAD